MMPDRIIKYTVTVIHIPLGGNFAAYNAERRIG